MYISFLYYVMNELITSSAERKQVYKQLRVSYRVSQNKMCFTRRIRSRASVLQKFMDQAGDRYHSGWQFLPHIFWKADILTYQSGRLVGENALPWQPGVKCWRMHLLHADRLTSRLYIKRSNVKKVRRRFETSEVHHEYSKVGKSSLHH